MHLPTRSSVLYGFRILQLVIAIGFLVLVCWSGVHRAWWNNINGPLAIAVISAILTFILSIFSIVTYHRNSNPLSGSTIRRVLRVSIDVVLLLIYIATAALMLRPRTGCNLGDPSNPTIAGFCYPAAPDNVIVQPIGRYNDQPLTEWSVGIAFAFLEIFTFIISIFLVFVEDRSSGKVGGGGASYA